MVYVSTKIKKRAAEAFEPEVIETDEYSIVKAQGFLHPLNSDSGLPFEAYTKEFGEDDAKKIRHARVELNTSEGGRFEDAVKNARKTIQTIGQELTSKQGNRRVCLIEGESIDNNVDTAVFHKIVEGEGKIFDLKFVVLDEKKEDYLRAIEEMRDSFTVK